MTDQVQRSRATGISVSPPTAERYRRWQRLVSRVIDAELDGIVIYGSGPTAPDPVRYFSGYVHPFPRARSLLLIPTNKRPILLIDQNWHQSPAEEMTWINDIRIVPSLTPDTPNRDSDQLRAALRDSGLCNTSIGLLSVDMPAAVQSSITDVVSDVRHKIGNSIWDSIVATPSDYDSDMMERTAQIADKALTTLTAACEAGRTEGEVCREMLSAMAEAGAEFQHANPISTHVDIGTYAKSKSNLQPFLYTETPIETGEQFWVDVIACYNGYYIDCDRTVVIGEPTAEQRRIYDACADMYEAMLKNIKPGVTGNAVYEAAQEIAAEYGYEDYLNGVYLGHTTGQTISTSPVVSHGVLTELTEGQFLNIEPGIHVPGVGSACIENTVQVTTDGPLVLNSAPIDLIHS